MKMNTFEVDFVILANKKICSFHCHTHICSQPEKIESALHSALFPGNFPFVHGGIVEIAAAIFIT